MDFRRSSPIFLPEALSRPMEASFALREEKDEEHPLCFRFPHTFQKGRFFLEPADKRERTLLRIGVVLSGGPAPGGHNVIAGLFDALHQLHPDAALFGYENGPSGLLENKGRFLKKGEIDLYRNTGGFDLLGTGRTKIETEEQMGKALKSLLANNLDGLLMVGGDDSNTNGALLAEYIRAEGKEISVLGVPKTIDGDLTAEGMPISFGFDTACKTYSELIGNLGKDALSMRKYVHFVKLMGRSASHIALECALATQPNLVLIGEERRSLAFLVDEIADLLTRRRKRGKEHALLLVPEGLLEFIPEMGALIQELNTLLAQGKKAPEGLSIPSRQAWDLLPESIQKQLLLTRDSHGNVRVSQIETESLLIQLVQKKLPDFSFQPHFFGYEGRSAFPTPFDAHYGYALGFAAALGFRDAITGAIVAIPNLKEPVSAWKATLLPLVDLFQLEMRKGKQVPVIRKTLVDLEGRPYQTYLQRKAAWQEEDCYLCPGPIQFFGEADPGPLCLRL